MTATLLIGFFLLLFLGMPIAVILGVITTISLLAFTSIPLQILPQQLYNALDSFVLMSVPFFVLAGSIMTKGVLAARLIRVITMAVGNFFGGLAMAGVLACMFFAALSGSSPATVVAVGTIMIPALMKNGYPENFSVGLITTAGSLGIVIPPSIPMILYCLVMNESVARLFMAGVGPGLLIGAALCLYVYGQSRRRGWRSPQRHTWAEFLTALRESLWALILPLIILGGIYSGLFTPTEAAAVSVVYALIVELVIYGQMKITDLPAICKEAAILSGALMFVLSCAMALVWLMTSQQLPAKMANFVISYVDSWWMFLIVINIVFLLLGTVMDNVSAMIILSPLLSDTLTRFQIDPIHYGIVMVLLIEFGFLTPPFGLNLFVAMAMTNKPLAKVSWAVAPFLIIMLLCVLIITFIPQISLFLPNLLLAK